MPDPPRILDVSPFDAGQRLDAFLASRLAISRAAVRRLLDEARVRVGEHVAALRDKGRPVASGERVIVTGSASPEEAQPIADPAAPLQVLGEGPGWVAVAKPAGQPVHPLRTDERGTLLGAAIARWPEMFGVGEGGLRSGIVHRLDVDTSGALLLARDEATWQRLRAAFRAHRVAKRYRALVHGAVGDAGRADLRLAVTQHRPARVRVLGRAEEGIEPGEWSARLAWRCLERAGGASLVEVDLETGFLHQVRVSFAWLGHPLLGDRGYGGAMRTSSGVAATRHMLHAAALRLDEIDVRCDDAPDFAAALAALRAARPALGETPGSRANAASAETRATPTAGDAS